MSEVSMKPWYMAVAVAVLVVVTVIVGEYGLAVQAVQSQFCGTFVEPYGYICAEYKTHSADGYELVMHRIGTIILHRSPGPVTSETDTASVNCKTAEQPFDTPGCSPLPPPSNEDNVPKSDEQSDQNGSDVDEIAPYQVDQTPSSIAKNPYNGDEDNAQEQKLPYERSPFSEGDVSASQETQHSKLPYHIRLKALSHKHHRPIRSLPKRSVYDTRSEVKDQKGSSVSTEKADSPRSSNHKHHNRRDVSVSGSVVLVSNEPDVPTVIEGLSTNTDFEAPGPVSSTQGPSFSDRPSVATKSGTPDRSPSAPTHSLSSSVVPSKATAMADASRDQDFQEFKQGRDPVLLMHQEFMNGDSWFQFTDAPDRLLPLLLVDAGFDVWIGHERATYWSHGHRHLKHNDQSYWNWTWDDQAKYDVPAFLGYIKDYTGFPVHYVGISQSATVGAAAATMPRSFRVMRSLTLIGPTIYTGDTSSFLLDAWAFLFGNAVDQANWNEGYQNGAFNFSRAFPVNSIDGRGPLAAAVATISGPNCCLGSTVVSFTNGWDGTTSFKNLIHYQQGVRTNTWRHFDYGNPYNNTRAYGVPYAPNYYPEDIPRYVPVLIIYGGQDDYAPPSGIQDLLSRFRTGVASVFLPAYAHYDLAYSVNRTQDVFLPILQFLEEKRWN